VQELRSRLLVHFEASLIDRLDHNTRHARENNHSFRSDIALNLSEEICEVGSSKVGGSTKSGEETGVVDLVELFLANVQHDGSKIKLLLEFSHEDVHLEQLSNVLNLCLTNDIHKPLELFLVPADPEEDEFLDLDTLVVLGSEDKVLEDGRERSNSNSTSNHDNILELMPVFIGRSVRSFHKNRRIRSAVGVVDLSHLLSPWSNSSNMNINVFLVWSGRDGEGVEQTI